MSAIVNAEYKTFLKEIKERIYKAQYDALKSVNRELINLYLDIGKSIVAKQENLGWGKAIVETLAKDLQKEFSGIQGFSSANLWRMRNFYLAYQKNEKLAPLVREISWTKNIIILERCKNNIRREFYIKATKKFGWTKDVLINQLEAGAFERYMANQTNFDKAVPEKYRHQAKLAVKDEYSFDFLEFGEEHSEKELELALLENVRKFLIEMGGYFTFVGNQYRLEIEGQEFFVDLLLYHRQLRCLVAKQQQPPLSPFDKGELFNANTSALEKQIAQMVYKLYDLTPEEIAIVEGRSNNGNKTRQAADKQLKAIESLPGVILREVFDFEEDREG